MASEKRTDAVAENDMFNPNLLAKQTLEHLQLITTAEFILKEKFNSDPTYWLSALFEALNIRNPAYLVEEKNSSNDVLSSSSVHNFNDSFWNEDNYYNVVSTSYHLISIFRKFMKGLCSNAEKFHLENTVPDLKDIEKNIHLYTKLIKQKEAKTEIVPNTTTNCIKEKESIRRPDTSDMCSECNSKITIFNNDPEFSYSLHIQEASHKKALTKPTSKNVEQTTKTFEKRPSEPEVFTKADCMAVRNTLVERIKNHCDLITILSKRDFHCKLCQCAISSIQNVISHVEGTKHRNAFKLYTSRILQVDYSDIPETKLM